VRRYPTRARAATGVAIAVVVAGCGGSGDRAGGEGAGRPVTLSVANPSFALDEVQPLLDEVARRSGGRVRLRLRENWLGWPWRRPEAAVVRDVAAGKADAGLVGARAWGNLGVTRFDALLAPFLVDTYALEEEVLASDVVGDMLGPVDGLGVEAVGVLPGPLRKLLGPRPLTSPGAVAGLRMGLQEGTVARATLRALGAVPVALPGGEDLGRLNGVEQHLSSIDSSGYDQKGSYLTTNVSLWPRAVVLFVGDSAYSRLDESQREALRAATHAAGARIIGVLRSTEQNATAQLCRRRRAALVTASSAGLASFRRAVAPVYARLRREPDTRLALDRIDALRRSAATDEAVPACPSARAASTGPIADGVYTNTTRRADAVRAHIPLGDRRYRLLPIRHRLVLRSGQFRLYDTYANGRTEGSMRGTYSVYRGRIVFRAGPDVISLAFSVDGRTLTFDDGGKGGYVGADFTPPWTKTG
jgi:TRAP-type transport system periplasmic protein